MLKVVIDRQVSITYTVHNKLNMWRHLIASLAKRPTYLREITPKTFTCIGATDTSVEGMISVFCSTSE